MDGPTRRGRGPHPVLGKNSQHATGTDDRTAHVTAPGAIAAVWDVRNRVHRMATRSATGVAVADVRDLVHAVGRLAGLVAADLEDGQR
jgi:hypothetical protein